MSGKGIDNSPAQVPGNDGGYVIVVTRWNEAIVAVVERRETSPRDGRHR